MVRVVAQCNESKLEVKPPGGIINRDHFHRVDPEFLLRVRDPAEPMLLSAL